MGTGCGVSLVWYTLRGMTENHHNRNLNQLFSLDELFAEIAAGHVKRQVHPEDPNLWILNYTEKAVFERAWNNITLHCRGLIVRYHAMTDSAEIVARPFKKFFNFGEHGENHDLSDVVEVYDKVDGSLGILYTDPSGQPAIATRGSFTSEQALHATQVYRERYHMQWYPLPEITYLFEIVYPENRIVLDYGEQDDLVLLGGVHIYGQVIGADEMWRYEGWPGPSSRRIGVMTLGEALKLAARENAEGVVTRSYQTGEMLKIKQDDYVTLHRMIFGLNERAVWEHLKTNNDVSALVESLPDEFKDWAEAVACELTEKMLAEHSRAADKCRDILWSLPRPWTDRDPREFRKEFALKARDFDHPGWLFLILDGEFKRLEDAIWDSLRPAHKPFSRTTTDTMETIAA